jgi:hypothetical protein
MVAHTCNSSYSAGKERRILNLRPVGALSGNKKKRKQKVWGHSSNGRTPGDPEFNPQHCKRKKKFIYKEKSNS